MEDITPKQKIIAKHQMVQELIARMQAEVIPAAEIKTHKAVRKRINGWVEEFEKKK